MVFGWFFKVVSWFLVEKGEEEIKKVKKRFNLQAAFEDLAKRQKIFNDTKNTIEGMFSGIQNNYDVMTMTLPEDKKDFVKKEVKAVSEKLVGFCWYLLLLEDLYFDDLCFY